MSEFEETVARLKKLTSAKLTPKQRIEVMATLESKYEGIQSLALQILARVGDQEAVDAIAKNYDRAMQKPSARSLRGVALQGLIKNIDKVDPQWAMEHVLYAKERGGLNVHYWTLVRLLPRTVVEKKLRQGKSSDLAGRRLAAAEIASALGC